MNFLGVCEWKKEKKTEFGTPSKSNARFSFDNFVYARKQCGEAWKQIKSNKLLAYEAESCALTVAKAAYQSTLPANL